MKILWIAFVWPEPQSSAAGFRTLQLLEACRKSGFELRISSGCQSNSHRKNLQSQGFQTEIFEPNDNNFDAYIKEYQPDIVVFDRFMVEEQFSWRVREHCPNALRVLDTIDLASLRRIRQKKVEKNENPLNLSDEDLQSDDALRELSAIFRSDLSLIISDAEMALLENHYKVPSHLLRLCRFFYEPARLGPNFSERRNFVTIGNFNHAPNSDSYRLLQKDLWPKIKTRLKNQGVEGVELHIYGAYPSKELMSLDNADTGFRVKGWAKDSKETLSNYRLSLAPLRFGAGIKGKVSDSWSVGTPCVGTSIAAEGMHESLNFGGIVCDDLDSFADAAVSLYMKESEWKSGRENGTQIIDKIFNADSNSAKFISTIELLVRDGHRNRAKNLVGAMLWYHKNRSTEYFSRWIESKNSLGANEGL